MAGNDTGKLKIGDHWNAISIIALSQNNPLKAIAEFVENSIDAGAKNVTLIRGKHKGNFYLNVIDDGHGIADFHYVATHIGDSVKRKLKQDGAKGIQGEFGIGLLSFWTVGEECVLTSAGVDGKSRSMHLVKGNPSYSIRDADTLFGRTGTEIHISPILAGVRTLSGEKIQNYLASELRDRIAKSAVRIRIVDKAARRELIVEPRQFSGRLIHSLPEIHCPQGEVYCELYMAEPSGQSAIGLYKQGTRVVPDITRLERFSRFPWNSSYVEGIIDASFLQLTPGTRDGVIFDAAYESFCASLEATEDALASLIEERKKAEDDEASRAILNRVTKALREAFLMLPSDEYGWLSAKAKATRGPSSDGTGAGSGHQGSGSDAGSSHEASKEDMPGVRFPSEAGADGEDGQKRFFDCPGPLHKAIISPASCIVRVGETKRLHAIARDRAKRTTDYDLSFEWRIAEGSGSLSGVDSEYCEFVSGEEPGVSTVVLTVRQGETSCEAVALITATEELGAGGERGLASPARGLPGYTYMNAPGELWRSRYEEARSLIVINKAHADFVYASRVSMNKLRYIARLFSKELVLANFPEATKEELLERMVELTLYMEEHLR